MIDRRRLLGLGLGCAMAPVVAVRGFCRSQTPLQSSDPILCYIKREAFDNYQSTATVVREGRRLHGEHYRRVGAHISLLHTRMTETGAEARINAAVRDRVSEIGIDAMLTEIMPSLPRLQCLLANDNVNAAVRVDLTRARDAFDVLYQHGVLCFCPPLRRWAVREGERSDRDGTVTARTVVISHQKPVPGIEGGGVYGWPEEEGPWMTCAEMTIAIDLCWVAIAFLVYFGQEPEAAAAGIIVAIMQLTKDLVCTDAT